MDNLFWNSACSIIFHVKESRCFIMGKFFGNKMGELTTQQIVLLIILLISFAIILFLLFRLNLGKESEKELCHNSVMLRGAAAVPSEATPLKCSRTYLCITKDGSCEGLTKPEIEKVKTKEEIYQVLADEMADCWWMFGEGKVDYIGDKLTHKNYCSICSQVLFDDSLSEIEGIGGRIDKEEVYTYLFENEIEEDVKYSYYLFRQNDFEELRQEISNEQGGEFDFGMIEIGKQYYVVMGIVSSVKKPWKAISGGLASYYGLGALRTFFKISPAGWVSGIIVGGVTVAGGVALTVSDLIDPEIMAVTVPGQGIDNQFMAPTIQEAESAKFKSLNCEEIITLS